MIKTLVFPHLTYPVVPLNTACDSRLSELQAAQNKAIRFALDVSWYDFVSAKRLHTGSRYKFTPLNQTLYWRARKVWDSITDGTSTDPAQFEILTNELVPGPTDKYHNYYPSSLDMARGPEPPPMYTYAANQRQTCAELRRNNPP